MVELGSASSIGNIINFSLSGTTSISFDFSGAKELFSIEIIAPDDPLAGGEADLGFHYSRVKFSSDGECCSPDTEDGTVAIDEYPFPCIDMALPTIAIGASTIEDGKIILPVSLEGTPSSTFPITQLQLTIEVTTSGNMALDEDAILNSLELESSISCPSGDDLVVNPATGEIEYFICRAGSPVSLRASAFLT